MNDELSVDLVPFFCEEHVVDMHLRRKLGTSRSGVCVVDQPHPGRSSGIGFDLQALADLVDEAAETYFDHLGFAPDGHQHHAVIERKVVAEKVLKASIEASYLESIVEVVSNLMNHEEEWFEPFVTPDEYLVPEWEVFEDRVKHETRLLSPPRSESFDLTAPELNHAFVQSMMVFANPEAGLIREITRGTKLYRARIDRDVDSLTERARRHPAKELGPAPAHLAAAGRMNPQGVPMFYVAQDSGTACAEVASHSPYTDAVVGTFIVQTPLRILDLTATASEVSHFNDSVRVDREKLDAIKFYVDRITQPVILDGSHPVDYVPSQILTEAFRWWSNPRIDGIAYPSRVKTDGINLVLFFGESRWFDSVGEKPSRFDRFLRGQERGSSAPVFVIDPKTVRNFRAETSVTVSRIREWHDF